MASLEREIEIYNANLASLMQDLGRYVLIRDPDIIGVFDTYEEALRKGYEAGPEKPFLAKKIAPAERVLHFTRSLLPVCP